MSFRSFDDAPRGLTLGILCALIAGAFTLMGGFATPVTASPSVDGNLDKAMEGLKNGLKSLSKTIKDPAQNEATLEALHEMQGHVMTAKLEKPDNLEEIEEAKHDEHTSMFRADLSRLMKELCDMEIAVLEGKNEEAMGMIRGKLVPMRNESHGKYQKN